MLHTHFIHLPNSISNWDGCSTPPPSHPCSPSINKNKWLPTAKNSIFRKKMWHNTFLPRAREVDSCKTCIIYTSLYLSLCNSHPDTGSILLLNCWKSLLSFETFTTVIKKYGECCCRVWSNGKAGIFNMGSGASNHSNSVWQVSTCSVQSVGCKLWLRECVF